MVSRYGQETALRFRPDTVAASGGATGDGADESAMVPVSVVCWCVWIQPYGRLFACPTSSSYRWS